MKGHEQLIEMRLNRMKPDWVFLEDLNIVSDWSSGDYPTINVYGDDLKTLDLRFLVGLRVLASSDDENRAKELLEACKRHRVRYCTANHLTGVGIWDNDGWLDSFGVM